MNEEDCEYEIIIKRRRNWGIALYTGFWILGCFGILITVSISLLFLNRSRLTVEIVFLMLLFLIPSLVVVKIFLWNLRGKEKISIQDGILKIEKLGTILKVPKYFKIRELDTLSFEKETSFLWKPSIWGLTGGNIHFNYIYKKKSFGQTVDEFEAIKIIEKINSIIKILKSNPIP